MPCFAGGTITMVEAAAETTVSEFKDLVIASLRADDTDFGRKVTSVELIVGGRQLLEDWTLAESDISPDTTVLAIFSRRIASRARQEDSEYNLKLPGRAVVLKIPGWHARDFARRLL